MKILIATDGSEVSRLAVKEIAGWPLLEGAKVQVLTVVDAMYPPPPEGWGVSQEFLEEIERTATARASDVVAAAADAIRERRAGLDIECVVLTGSPKFAILDHADAWGADLIVLGSHGYSRLERLILGSVSQAVASHAGCSVMIVRPRSDAGGTV
jgi:nucleotide-binding universal stress UspA family protein